MAKKVKQTERFGLTAQSADGWEWEWEAATYLWRWMKSGQLGIVGPLGFTVCAYAKTLPEALAYTAGLTDGRSQERRKAGESQQA